MLGWISKSVNDLKLIILLMYCKHYKSLQIIEVLLRVKKLNTAN